MFLLLLLAITLLAAGSLLAERDVVHHFPEPHVDPQAPLGPMTPKLPR